MIKNTIINIFLFSLCLLYSSCSLFFKDGSYVQDNIAEEVVEEVVRVETGLNLDLTPGTPEKK
jgi:hypothetical protein